MHDEIHDDHPRGPPFSRDALHVFALILRSSGTMRILPLLRSARMPWRVLAAAVDELEERCWVKVTWRHPRAHLPEGLPEAFREVERVTTTAFGRWRYPMAPRNFS